MADWEKQELRLGGLEAPSITCRIMPDGFDPSEVTSVVPSESLTFLQVFTIVCSQMYFGETHDCWFSTPEFFDALCVSVGAS